MTAISLYSGGCDGLSLAASWVGIETAGFCECDEDCRKQLHRRHPGKPVFRYDTEVTRDALRDNGIDPDGIDIILASPPCQCASVAGKRLGAADERNRWPECLRILRDVRPRWFLGENVPGLLSVDDGRLFAGILGELAEMGYDAGWCVYGTGDIGAPHQRDRLCIVAHSNSVRRASRRTEQRGQQWETSSSSGSHVADADCKRLQISKQFGTHPICIRAGGERPYGAVNQCGEVGDARSGRLPGDQRWRPGSELAVGCERTASPGMGLFLDGVSRMVAAHRWPAGRGEPQHDWEPSRTVRGMKGRAALIKMLGNAVVPQWAVIPLAVIAELEGVARVPD